MWVVVHTFFGLALGAVLYERLGWPWWLVALLAVVSHVLLDLIPHWDYTVDDRLMLWGWLDFVGALAACVGLLLAGVPFAVVALGPVSGAPDFDVLVRALRGERGRYWFPSHWRSFPHGTAGPGPGIAVQAVVIVASALAFALAYR